MIGVKLALGILSLIEGDTLEKLLPTSRSVRAVICARLVIKLFPKGSSYAKLMLIGEGPGADEDATGIPFVGKAGQI